MQVLRISNLDSFASLGGDWNAMAAGVPFRTMEWLSTWWEHYQPAMQAVRRHVELYTLCAIDGDELVGLAPWYLERSSGSGGIIRFLGSNEVCSDYLSILCRPQREADVAEAFAQWLTLAGDVGAASRDRWDVLEWTGVDASEEMPPLLGEQLRLRGAEVHIRATENTWRIELPETLEDFFQLLSKSHRKQLRQLQRRFLETGRAALRTVEKAEDLERGWQVLADLHQRRSESLGREGCFKSASFAQFHRAATERLLQAGRVGLYWLEVDGQPVAADYHLLGENVVFAYQGGIEPTALEFEPGRLITLATIERAINAGYRAFDFCRGDEPYKSHWRAKPRNNIAWRIACNRTSARLRNRVWIAGQSARQWVKRALDASRVNSVDGNGEPAQPAKSWIPWEEVDGGPDGLPVGRRWDND